MSVVIIQEAGRRLNIPSKSQPDSAQRRYARARMSKGKAVATIAAEDGRSYANER